MTILRQIFLHEIHPITLLGWRLDEPSTLAFKIAFFSGFHIGNNELCSCVLLNDCRKTTLVPYAESYYDSITVTYSLVDSDDPKLDINEIIIETTVCGTIHYLQESAGH